MLFINKVSIQPKQETGLRVVLLAVAVHIATSFNPAEARDGFKRQKIQMMQKRIQRFNPAEARDGFKRAKKVELKAQIEGFNPAEARDGFKRKFSRHRSLLYVVSIQPKQETGLRVNSRYDWVKIQSSFNPAEARDGFKRESLCCFVFSSTGFNPAEARDGFKSRPICDALNIAYEFQSSRSKRRV